MSTVLTEKEQAEKVTNAAKSDVSSQPIKSDQERAAYSVSPEMNRPQYD